MTKGPAKKADVTMNLSDGEYDSFKFQARVCMIHRGKGSIRTHEAHVVDTFMGLADGKVNGQKAFMTGALKVKGNVMLAVSTTIPVAYLWSIRKSMGLASSVQSLGRWGRSIRTDKCEWLTGRPSSTASSRPPRPSSNPTQHPLMVPACHLPPAKKMGGASRGTCARRR